MAERRRSRRYELQLPANVFYEGQTPEPGRLCDLAGGGAMVLSPLHAEFGTHVQVRFVLEPDIICEAWGNALRTIPFGSLQGVAVEFEQMNDAFGHFLQNLENAVADERGRFLEDVRDLWIKLTVAQSGEA